MYTMFLYIYVYSDLHLLLAAFPLLTQVLLIEKEKAQYQQFPGKLSTMQC